MYIVWSIKFFSPTCSCLSGFKWLCLHRRDGGETPLPPPHRLATPTWATGKSRWIRCTPTSTCCSSSRGCCWTPRRSGSSADTLGKKKKKKKHSRHTQSSPSPLAKSCGSESQDLNDWILSLPTLHPFKSTLQQQNSQVSVVGGLTSWWQAGVLAADNEETRNRCTGVLSSKEQSLRPQTRPHKVLTGQKLTQKHKYESTPILHPATHTHNHAFHWSWSV